MKRKLVALVLAASCCALWAACKSGGEPRPDAVLSELDAFTSELVKKIDEAPDPSVGVDEAQKLLDERKNELAKNLGALRKSDAYARDERLRQKVMENEFDNYFKVSGLPNKYTSLAMDDPALRSKLDKLVADYQTLFKQ